MPRLDYRALRALIPIRAVLEQLRWDRHREGSRFRQGSGAGRRLQDDGGREWPSSARVFLNAE